ncbi:uncharacterized protein FPRN_06787 [Fusarium proliferatum]|nr:uncharacterized protein FPRN_06787 [Fusarium proliferatum]
MSRVHELQLDAKLFDIEMNVGLTATQPSLGFSALSSWIVSDSDQELLVFRKFREISARNLLYLQCELLSIESRLKAWDKQVEGSNDTVLEQVAETWEVMIEQAEAGKTEAKDMLELVKLLRIKIKEYHEALDLQSRISLLNNPDQRALEVARNELHGGSLQRDGQKPNPMLGGRGKDYLDEAEDLVSLKASAAVDPLSKLLRAYWPGRVRFTIVINTVAVVSEPFANAKILKSGRTIQGWPSSDQPF